MGLFVNEHKNPKVYKNEDTLIEPNQNMYRQDELVDMMKAQQQTNEDLRKALHEMEKAYKNQSKVQTRRLANVRYHIEELYNSQRKQEENEGNTSKSIEQFHDKTEVLSEKMEQQIVLQKELAEKLLKQEGFQQEVIQRLENQEALAEKILRKVDHFRSILYERTNFINDKIGKGYEATSAYITKLIKTNDTPKAPEKIKEHEKSID